MNRKTMSIATILVLVALAAMLFAGCGSESEDPQASLEQATQNAREAGSVHAQLNVTLDPQDGQSGMGVNVQGDAWLDTKNKTMEATLTVLGLNASLRYVDGKGYLKWGNNWYELTGELMPGIGKGAIDALVNLLSTYPDLFSNAEISVIGDKKVGNYDCTNYEIVPDLDALAAMPAVQQLASQLGMKADELQTALAQSGLQMQVAIQKSEPVIREIYLAANVTLPQGGKVMGMKILPEKAHIEAQIDFPEYGITVQVQAPPDAKPFKGLGDLLKF